MEDGEMESFVGSGSTEFESLLDGLTKCLEQIPSTLPIVIRSKHRTVLQLGKRWMEYVAFRRLGVRSPHDLVGDFMKTLTARRLNGSLQTTWTT